ncbi:diguanylate cyclase/phosphodiesterase (GGDEF & EAL domains) with PAS/PAC sensor(s) [Myxococcus hansupus]|uniref:Diguanylate cyclase/phosphodiesterase (GGDEF & EAL domains) with PAS/PAC sensor(S) n=1 Tax=Pseudomyxococcus hansupus TaxID=1297742 RepID=A0A0H4XMI4_9BACT|nr:hypothetical protein [Myxococcus hansupus]AKQ69502.1 diguanylate cyclase/phosphodiesterase (GGDEF & EAL domains) with PAS/PAC sensor(s) [Myxococcus hansupus]
MEDALSEGRAREDAAVEAWVRRTGQMPPRKIRRKWEKQWRREAKHEARRAEQALRSNRSRNPGRGAAYVAIAITCVLMALGQPRRLWWLAFVALGLLLASVKHLERPRRDESRAGEAEPPPRTPSGAVDEDPRVAKVDALCARLMEALRDGPPVLREVVHAPERTVEALRQGCHALVRRERELRALVPAEASQRLAEERETLAARVATESDAVVKERLSGALAALDAQRHQRAELVTAAARLEAEHMRLYYTLEGLYAQVLRVRSADTVDEDVAGQGLRQSVEQLGAEVEAVTQALEEVHGAPGGRVRTR